MPFELDAEDELLDPALLDELALLAGLVVDPELDEFEPQAATPSSARTRRAAARRRLVLVIVVFISNSFGVRARKFRPNPLDAVLRLLVPGRYRTLAKRREREGNPVTRRHGGRGRNRLPGTMKRTKKTKNS